MKQRTKVFLGVGIILAAIGFLMFTAFSESTMYFFTVDEVLARSKGEDLRGKPVRVQGAIDQESIEFDIQKPLLRFKIKGDSGQLLQVEYVGVKPDNMKEATSAIVEGKFNDQGVIVASKLMMQCPSKYEAEGGGKDNGSAPGFDPMPTNTTTTNTTKN